MDAWLAFASRICFFTSVTLGLAEERSKENMGVERRLHNYGKYEKLNQDSRFCHGGKRLEVRR